MAAPHHSSKTVDILLCTFRRPSVADTLRSLAGQKGLGDTSLRVIIADNDSTPSAQGLVSALKAEIPFDVLYLHAPERNISIARNACLDAAEADWIAFIDDDETAPEDWIATLLQEAGQAGMDAMIAPALAQYEAGAPAWMAEGNYHSNLPVRRNGEVTTGHTCNALLRWAGTPWSVVRFDLSRGRSGGEDTAFFFEVRAKGARLGATDKAAVTEPVDPKRLRMGWILRRKFRAGQSYASSARSAAARGILALSATAKAAVSALAVLCTFWSPGRRNFWFLRAALHLGVVAGCLSLPEPQSYGA